MGQASFVFLVHYKPQISCKQTFCHVRFLPYDQTFLQIRKNGGIAHIGTNVLERLPDMTSLNNREYSNPGRKLTVP